MDTRSEIEKERRSRKQSGEAGNKAEKKEQKKRKQVDKLYKTKYNPKMQMICKYDFRVISVRKEYETKPRNLMLQYIKEQKSRQFSAADIYEFLENEGCHINLATVYRNLEKLSEEGTLMRYKFADNKCCLYQYADDSEQCKHHLHMKCQFCGIIIHLDCTFMHEIAQHLQEDHGFEINCKGSVLLGTCAECRIAGKG